MRFRLKELLVILNTASIAGIIFFLEYRDSNAAMIGGLIVFISFILLYFLQKNIGKRRPRNY